MPTGLRIESREDGEECVLTLAGELSLAKAHVLEQRLGEALAASSARIVIDLAQVEFIDSTGLSVLVRAHQRASERDVELGLVNLRAQASRLLSLTGLTERLTLAHHPQASKSRARTGSDLAEPGPAA